MCILASSKATPKDKGFLPILCTTSGVGFDPRQAQKNYSHVYFCTFLVVKITVIRELLKTICSPWMSSFLPKNQPPPFVHTAGGVKNGQYSGNPNKNGCSFTWKRFGLATGPWPEKVFSNDHLNPFTSAHYSIWENEQIWLNFWAKHISEHPIPSKTMCP